SGSRRRHGCWWLEAAGFRTVIAPSFADIFRTNCLKIGVLPVELAQESVRALMDAVLDDPTTEITVDLQALRVRAPPVHEPFEIDPYTRWRLLEGLDDIELTLRNADAIDAYERARPARLPSATRACSARRTPPPRGLKRPFGRLDANRAMSKPEHIGAADVGRPRNGPIRRRASDVLVPRPLADQPLRRESDGWRQRRRAHAE